jgi:hypothetical protein
MGLQAKPCLIKFILIFRLASRDFCNWEDTITKDKDNTIITIPATTNISMIVKALQGFIFTLSYILLLNLYIIKRK